MKKKKVSYIIIIKLYYLEEIYIHILMNNRLYILFSLNIYVYTYF